jgi:HAD superfamily hydrolase (TIGR01509 family)
VSPVEGRSLVIFDLDGVLVDSFEAWRELLNEALKRRRVRPLSREEFAKTWGQDVEADRRQFFPDWTFEELERHYEGEFPKHLARIEPEPGAREVLSELKRRRKKLAIASNSPGPIALRILEHLKLRPLLDTVATVDQVGRGKPEPDLLEYVLDRSGIDAGESCYVGDSRFDEAASRSAGIFFIGYRRPGDHRIERLEDLLE